jgi:hypothetical protein
MQNELEDDAKLKLNELPKQQKIEEIKLEQPIIEVNNENVTNNSKLSEKPKATSSNLSKSTTKSSLLLTQNLKTMRAVKRHRKSSFKRFNIDNNRYIIINYY